MRIRHKLLALLLIFAVLPLLLSVAFSHLFFYRSGMHLAEEAEKRLSGQAHSALQKIVNGFQQLQERDRKMMEAALNLQSGDRHVGSRADSSIPLAYSAVMSYRPGTVSHQITIHETGQSSCYPSADNCPGDKDLRQFPWYQTTRSLKTLTRTLALDPASGEQAVIVASPLTEEDGRFIGVTALVRPVAAMFADLRLSENWFGEAREMLVAIEPGEDSAGSGLRIFAWRETESPIGLISLSPQKLLQPDSPDDNRRLLQRIAEGQGGSLKLNLGGIETHWIFGAVTCGEPFALVLIPHSQVIAQAVAARTHVVEKILKGLGISVALLVCAIGAVFYTAVLASKKVTRPLSQLASAASLLVGGDYTSRVEIETKDEVAELGQVFNQLGPALAERERMASALALAGDVQRHLLPQKQPCLGGFDIFGGALSCDETGGDYYDFMPLTAGSLSLAVGDVSGHGVGAALLMAGARGVLRSHASRYNLKIPTLFTTLNQHLCRDTADEKFMTLFYGVLSEKEKTLHWCSAGHGPHFFYRRLGKEVIELGSTGLPLGIVEEAGWEMGVPLVFGKGDILLIGTDGIWEAHNPAGEVLGTERLKKLICSNANETAAQIHASVMELVRNFGKDLRQEDDITLSVIKAV